MTAYLVLTSGLILLTGMISLLNFVIRGETTAIVRAFGEFAIAAWGAYLIFR